MPDLNIVDANGVEIDNADVTSKPNNRLFRDAWVTSGTVISEDVDLARASFLREVRKARDQKLKEEDIVYMRAIEADDASAKTASATKKQSLRDAPASTTIANATTIEQLKSAWDTDLLGDNPYS